MSEEQAPEIQINVKGPSELKLQISITTDKTVLELKQAIAAKSDVEADRQRLIYSGRVLKDEDLLSVYKIQSGHTIHMVKGVARSTGGSSSSSSAASSTPQQLPTMQAGQNVHDPLTQLNGHMGFGAMAGLNPFGELGLNPNDPNMMQSMLNSPQFLQQMSSMLSNPDIMDQIIASNPQMAAMGPQLRQTLQDPAFRQMISNPEYLSQMMRMANMFRSAGGGGAGGFGDPFGLGAFGGGGGQPSFPAPGNPNPNPNPNSSSSPSSTTPSTTTPAPGTGAGAGTGTGATSPPPLNPFGLFAGLGAGAGAGAAGAGAGATSPGAGATPNPLNPFGLNPALMQQMMGMYGGAGAGTAGGAGLGGFGAPAPPADTRPPEERFQVQLQQLQDMGFTNASQNVRALLATGGNVHSAIEYILGGGGL